ncbi:MAG: hypothetical protein D4R94_04560 [Chitinophagaceae bacterium]|nr:MAG: hypothetical protein D4R94_04560 [Chitinophagaceae bacterium]
MAQCQFCGGTLGVKVRFCSNCGKPIVATKATDSSTPYAGSVVSSTKEIKATASQVKSGNSASQLDTKTKKPNSLSIDAMGRTLFIVPEYFLSQMKEILAEFGVHAAGILSSPDPSLLVDMSQQFIRNALQGTVQYVCIVGDWRDVPPSNVPNDFMDFDSDEFCQTDALFGATEEFNSEEPFTAIPEITVGRIPLADRKIVHRVLISDPDVPDSQNSFQYGVTAQCWEVASKEIVSSFTNLDSGSHMGLSPEDTNTIPKSAVLCSPEWTEQHFRQIASPGPSEPFGVIFFNVHGGADDPQWVGESKDGDYVEIFQPGTISDFNSALLLTEACYGGAMFYDSPSIVEHFFSNGGNSFVGSSTIAYGARSTPLSSADLIAKHYISSLYAGLSQGESLKLAKLEALTEDPLSVEYGLKTALSFNLFGAPWQTLTRSPTTSVSNTAAQGTSTRSSGSILDKVRGNLYAPSRIKNDTINKIRDRYLGRLPPRNRQFMIEKAEILTKLREFRDFSRIIQQIDEFRGSLEDSKMDFVSAGDSKCYRLFCQTDHPNKSKKSLTLMIDSHGQLKKTIVSKGSV